MDSISARNQPRVGVFREKPGSDIVKQGYLKKLKTMKKKYFVLRSTSSSGPARFDYYDSERKFKSAHPPKRSIPLYTCFNVNKKMDTKHKNALALFLSEDCFSIIAENETEQEAWLNLLLEYQNEFLVDGEPPKVHYELVWQGVIKQKSSSSCYGISGPYRLCLSDKSVCLIKTKEVRPSFTFQFASIRRCGHSDNCFFMEVGRSSVTGAGELWMQVEETSTAENMHNAVLAEMHASRASSTDHSFRRRSNTGSSNVVPIRTSTGGDEPFHRKRATSESHHNSQGSPRKARTGLHRPQSTVVYSRSSNLAPESPIPMGSSPGRPFEYPFDDRIRSDSMSSRSSRTSRHSDMAEPPYENVPGPGHPATLPYEAVASPQPMENSYSARSQTPDDGYDQLDNSDYLPMTPGQRSMTPSPTRGAMSSSDYLPMTPGQRSGTPSPTRQADRPGSAGSDGQELSSRSEGYMDMRPGSLVSSPASTHSSYMDMTPPASSGYIDMTPGQRTPTDPSYMVMEAGWARTTAPIPIRTTKEPGYIDMGPASQPLPTVKEGGSGEAYLPMSPTGQSPVSSAGLKPAKVISYLSDDSMSGEFPKRAYSVGSRPVPKTAHRYHQPTEFLRRQPLDNSRSSSAPHLIVQKSRSQYPDVYRNSEMSQCVSPLSQSIKSDDSDSFMEMDFYRPRTASDSYGSRQRSSSFGKQFIQGHRPRSSSYGQASRGKLAKIVSSGRTDSFESVRTASQELNPKHRSQESLSKYSNSSRNSSNESLKKLSEDLKTKKSLMSDYMDMGFDKRKTPSPNVHGVVSPKVDNTGYVDMTLGTSAPKSSSRGISPSSSTHSLGSSPASVGQGHYEKTQDTKVIKASGKAMQKQTFAAQQASPADNQLKISVAGINKSDKRSPSSSGKESEDENYVPFQPITTAASHEDVIYKPSGITLDPVPRSHPGLKVQHGYSKSFDSAVKEPKPKTPSKHDKHLKLKIDDKHKTKSDDEKLVEKEGKHSGKPTEKEGKHSGKPMEKEGKHSGKLVEKEGKHSGKPTEKEGKHSGKPVEKEGKHSGKPVEKEGKHSGKPVEKESKHSGKPVEKEGKHSGKLVEKEGKHSGKHGHKADKAVKHEKQATGVGIQSPVSAASLDTLQEKVAKGHSPTLERKLDFIPDTDLFSNKVFKGPSLVPSASVDSDSGTSKVTGSPSTPVSPPQAATPDSSQYMEYCPGTENVSETASKTKDPENKKVPEEVPKTSRPVRHVEREYCEIDLPVAKSADPVEDSDVKTHDRSGSVKGKPKSPRVSSAKANENFTYMDFDPALEKKGEENVSGEVKAPHRVRSFVAHSETDVEKAVTVKEGASDAQGCPKTEAIPENNSHKVAVRKSSMENKENVNTQNVYVASQSVTNEKRNSSSEETGKDVCVGGKTQSESEGDKKPVIGDCTEDKVINAKFVVKRTKSAHSHSDPEVVEDEGYVDLDFSEVKSHKRSSSSSSSNSDKSRKLNPDAGNEACCEDNIPCPETPISYICDDSVPSEKSAVAKEPGSPFKLTGNAQMKKSDQLRMSSGGRQVLAQSSGNGGNLARQCSVPAAPCHSPRSSTELHSGRSRKASGPPGFPSITKSGNGSGGSAGKRSGSASAQLGLEPVPAGQELQKQKSMPCMNIEKKQVGEIVPEIGQSRHSFTDLSQYEEMSFPAEKLETGKGRSNSQQQLSESSQEKFALNYAELELHSSAENVEDKSPRIVKSRHPSSIEDLTPQGDVTPVSYAEIDYLKTESMKNSGNKEVKFTL